ncbi:hypothetical protein E5345_11850 [Propionibacterium sp. NM47_B9-13]|uniref:Uncharacterized protein n=1 Tax=Cutibacterium modestum HL044PA1 TaxID=765109 RepID=A0ABN0C7M5_9ACTN|nr:hypothetical protein HMPREF9621_00894 [Cutibacterium modestum HL037PA2]EFS93337.1 hypothetical protein HMPREF9607_00550 [Cutibacterium modestum HL044PA1]REB75187.1 hypothetical protein CP877_05205 [Cutibacterium modestum]TGY27656.1 hypothetical protein E5345_11850 [Propionibacterium sp. NM47_B9-13]
MHNAFGKCWVGAACHPRWCHRGPVLLGCVKLPDAYAWGITLGIVIKRVTRHGPRIADAIKAAW